MCGDMVVYGGLSEYTKVSAGLTWRASCQLYSGKGYILLFHAFPSLGTGEASLYSQLLGTGDTGDVV